MSIRSPSPISVNDDERRLAPALLALFPDRVMLSSHELSEVVRLEESGAPLDQLLAWARELKSARQGQRLSQTLQQLHAQAKRWRGAHVGGKYQESVEVSPAETERALSELISEVRRAEASSHDSELRAVISWLTRQLSDLKRRVTLSPQDLECITLAGVFQTLRELEDELAERVLITAPVELQTQVSKQVRESLIRESHRARPQDFIIAQRAVYWLTLSRELGLPPLRLPLFDQW